MLQLAIDPERSNLLIKAKVARLDNRSTGQYGIGVNFAKRKSAIA